MRGLKCPQSGVFTPNPEGNLRVPCGKCQECLKQRSNEWALRSQHEMSLHKQNCFITLTYNNDHIVNTTEELTREIQLFFKKLRKQIYPKKIRYLYSVEYGSNTLRPHYHAIIFGHDFAEQKLVRKTKKGFPLFTSPELLKLWPYGHHSIGTATVQSAYYIASYALKKHSAVNEETGEIVSDYMRTSRRPAIGLEYFKKNVNQLIDSKIPLPRYYQKKLESDYPNLYQIYTDRLASFNHSPDDFKAYSKLINMESQDSSSSLRSEPDTDNQKKLNTYLKTSLQKNLELKALKGKK